MKDTPRTSEFNEVFGEQLGNFFGCLAPIGLKQTLFQVSEMLFHRFICFQRVF
jgi:hypothetical protein